MYADADLGGCPHTARPTFGLFLVVQGCEGTFASITCSTADAERHPFAEGMFTELLPASLPIQKLWGDDGPKPIARDDNSTVTQAILKGTPSSLSTWLGPPSFLWPSFMKHVRPCEN